MNNENTRLLSFQEEYFVNTFPLIRQIASRYLGALHAAAIEDVSQSVALRLWKWKSKESTRVLSEDEWLKYANTATRNEIKRFCASKFRREIPVSDIEEESEMFYQRKINYHLAGNTDAEAASFLGFLWKLIGELSLRQKYALLLENRRILSELVGRGCCTIEELTRSLELSREEFLTLAARLPLSTAEIQQLLEKKTGCEITIKQIWFARGKAKAKLAARLREIE